MAKHYDGSKTLPQGLWNTLFPGRIHRKSPQIGNYYGDRKLIRRSLFNTAGSFVGNGPNTVSGSAVSNTELREFFCLSEFLSAYYLCAKVNSPSFSQNSPSLPSEFSSPKQYSRNSIPPVSYFRWCFEYGWVLWEELAPRGTWSKPLG